MYIQNDTPTFNSHACASESSPTSTSSQTLSPPHSLISHQQQIIPDYEEQQKHKTTPAKYYSRI